MSPGRKSGTSLAQRGGVESVEGVHECFPRLVPQVTHGARLAADAPADGGRRTRSPGQAAREPRTVGNGCQSSHHRPAPDGETRAAVGRSQAGESCRSTWSSPGRAPAQVGPVRRGAAQRLVAPPARDLPVVAGEQHGGHVEPAPDSAAWCRPGPRAGRHRPGANESSTATRRCRAPRAAAGRPPRPSTSTATSPPAST